MSYTLTTDEKIALARAPITRGILATLGTNHVPGKPACGCGNDGSKSPVTGKLGQTVGWMRNPQKQR